MPNVNRRYGTLRRIGGRARKPGFRSVAAITGSSDFGHRAANGLARFRSDQSGRAPWGRSGSFPTGSGVLGESEPRSAEIIVPATRKTNITVSTS